MKQVMIIAALVFASIASFAQDKDKQLGKEVTGTDLKSNYKLFTTDHNTFAKLEPLVEKWLVRVVITYRRGRRYSLYVKLEDKEAVLNAIK